MSGVIAREFKVVGYLRILRIECTLTYALLDNLTFAAHVILISPGLEDLDSYIVSNRFIYGDNKVANRITLHIENRGCKHTPEFKLMKTL